MFTGLIEEIATVAKLQLGQQSARIGLRANLVMGGLKLGDSIAVNGACLTVVAFDSSGFTADAVPETLRQTNLGELSPGAIVNVERALRVGDRLGGHFVSGHVDGVGVLAARSTEGIAEVLTISPPTELMPYIVAKGSICMDGVSLTVMDTSDTQFRVSIIPHTSAHTTLFNARVGTRINLECDILAKYIEKLLMRGGDTSIRGADSANIPASSIDLSFLAKHGFA